MNRTDREWNKKYAAVKQRIFEEGPMGHAPAVFAREVRAELIAEIKAWLQGIDDRTCPDTCHCRRVDHLLAATDEVIKP